MILSDVDFLRPWLLVAVHKKVREFDAKLFLAGVAVEHGFNVILGRTGLLNQLILNDQLPKGIYVGVTIAATREERFSEYRNLGNAVAAFCEEATAVRDWKYYQKKKVSGKTVSQLDYFFAWGQQHADIIAEIADGSPAKVLALGHPRYDVLRPEVREYYEEQANRLKDRFGRFILINTNVGTWVLTESGRDATWQKYLNKKMLTQKDEPHFRKQADFQLRNHQSFMTMAKGLATAFPEFSIIIRPHPTSVDAQWTGEINQSSPNLHVVYEGSVIPWIMASEAMIQRDCTTAVEGFLLGKPVFSYEEVENDGYSADLPTVLSHSVNDMTELAEGLAEILSTSNTATDTTENNKIQQTAVYNFGAYQGPLASDKIAERLIELELPAESAASARTKLTRLFVVAKIKLPLWMMYRFFISKRQQVFSLKGKTDIGSDLKFKLSEVKQGLDAFRQTTGRFQDVAVNAIDNESQLFLIYSDKDQTDS